MYVHIEYTYICKVATIKMIVVDCVIYESKLATNKSVGSHLVNPI